MSYFSRTGVFILLCSMSLASWSQVPMEVKGVPIGANSEQVIAKLDNPKCFANDDEGPAESYCMSINQPGDMALWNDSFAGKPSAIVYHMIADQVGEVTVAGLRADEYEELLSALIAKYGRPSLAHPKVQTKGGATFENTVATWTLGKDEIVFDRYGRTMEYSWLRFTAGSYAEARRHWQAKRAMSATSDM